MSDEVIAELWRTKDDMAREYGYDVGRLAAALQAEQGGEGRRVVDLHALREAGEATVARDKPPIHEPSHH